MLAIVSASVAATIVFTLGTGSAAERSARPGSLVAASVRGSALALAPDGTPVVAYVRGRTLYVARLHGKTWRAARAATLVAAREYRVQVVLDHGGRQPTVLAQDGAGRWLGVAVADKANRWSWHVVARAPARGWSLGPAGLTLDERLEPVVASAAGSLRQSSLLRMIRLRGDRVVSSTSITRRGFPFSLTAPAAMPVLLRDRRLHVVETFGATHSVQGVEWGRESNGWWGQTLQAGVYERAVGPVRALVDTRGTLWSAWTAFGFGKDLVVLASRSGVTGETSLFPDASLAALALGPQGPELAVNGPRGARIIAPGRVAVAVPGTVADLAVDAQGRRNLLVVRRGSLFLVRAPLGRRVPTGI